MFVNDVIVIGGSVGEVEAVSRLVQDLPTELAAADLVAIHWASSAEMHLI
jgi:chemotaxis response regulator CheB